nr:cytochrome c3 family protein [Geothrix paludis]
MANSYGALNYCTPCHMTHGALGGTLTYTAGNANLCLSCHVTGGRVATTHTFAPTDQALPPRGLPTGTAPTGTSHRWDSGAAGRVIKGSPNTSTGSLVLSGDYTGAYPTTVQIKINAAGQAGAATFDWQMTVNGTSAWGTATTGTFTSTAPVALGSTGISVAFVNGSANPSFIAGDLYLIYARPDLQGPVNTALSTRMQNGQLMCSTCHDQHLQANAPFDPAAAGISPGSAGRHFQRLPNTSDQMCVDCHAPRNVTAKGGTSHPITLPLPATSDYNKATSPITGITKLSVTSNVECQSCHDIHGAPVANGNLLRAEATGAAAGTNPLCDDCHTYAKVATNKGVHFDPTKGVLWPGGQWVTPSTSTPASSLSTYPAFNYSTDAAKRATCVNCHDPHGWPDARTTSAKYAKLLVDDPSDLCLACHDANGQINTTGGNQVVPNIQQEIIKPIHHPVERTSGRTVMCADCHNPHKAVAGSHTYTTTATLTRNQIMNGTTVQSGPLMGVDGVRYSPYPALWVSPTASNFTATPTATYEYEVCFKCHTAYSFGSTPPNGITSGGTSTLTLVSGSTQPWVAGVGTAKFNNNSQTVNGTSTNWTTTNMAGQYVRPVGGTVNTYRVTASTTTSLTISAIYGQTTTAYVAYETRDAAAITGTTTVTGYGTTWPVGSTPGTGLVGQFFAMTSGNTNSYQITASSATSLTITTATTSTTPQDFYIHPGASFSNGKTAVVGYGTNWTSALVGGQIQAVGGTAYTISSVTDATHLTLSANFGQTSTIARFNLASPVLFQETDVAREFNPNNRSGHPVVASLNNYTGSYAPKALVQAQMLSGSPWVTNVGNQTMMCSDCHNTDGAAAQGPHGSANQFMLKGANSANWPNVTLQNFSTSWCANCHTTFSNDPHGGHHLSYPCYDCHVVIPHGSLRSRLIGDRTNMPTRYAYQNNLNNMQIQGFQKASSMSSYTDKYCQAACDSQHSAVPAANEPW